MVDLLLIRAKEDNETLLSHLRPLPQSTKILHVPLVSYDILPLKKEEFKSQPDSKFIVTSPRAADYVIKNHSDFVGTTFYVVGRTSAEKLRNSGLSVAHTAHTASELLSNLKEHKREHSYHYVYLRGEIVRTEIAPFLGEAGISCNEIIVYRAHYTISQNSQDIKNSNEEIVLPLYSEALAKTYIAFLEKNDLTQTCMRTHIIAISETVLSAVSKYKWRSTSISVNPESAEMVSAISKKIREIVPR